MFKPIWSPYLTTNDWTEALNQLKQVRTRTGELLSAAEIDCFYHFKTNELSGQSSSKSNSLASLALEQDDVFEEFRKELISSKPPSKRQISSDYICHACGVKTHLIEDCPVSL